MREPRGRALTALATSPKSGLTRAEAYGWVVRLKREGMTAREIARELCVTRYYVRDLINDPSGEKARERKRRALMQDCEKCGARAWSRLCQPCAHAQAHDERQWNPEAIIEAFVSFHAATGRAPSTTDYMARTNPSIRVKCSPERLAQVDAERALPLPPPQIVKREFGSWPDAVAKAGFTPNPHGPRRVGRVAVRPAAEGDLLCSDCGRFVRSLIERTGFCSRCTTEHDQRQAAA